MDFSVFLYRDDILWITAFTLGGLTFALGPIIIVGVFVFVVSFVIWFILKATMGIRVDEESEVNGLDMSELGMEAYPEFTT